MADTEITTNQKYLNILNYIHIFRANKNFKRLMLSLICRYLLNIISFIYTKLVVTSNALSSHTNEVFYQGSREHN